MWVRLGQWQLMLVLCLLHTSWRPAEAASAIIVSTGRKGAGKPRPPHAAAVLPLLTLSSGALPCAPYPAPPCTPQVIGGKEITTRFHPHVKSWNPMSPHVPPYFGYIAAEKVYAPFKRTETLRREH